MTEPTRETRRSVPPKPSVPAAEPTGPLTRASRPVAGVAVRGTHDRRRQGRSGAGQPEPPSAASLDALRDQATLSSPLEYDDARPGRASRLVALRRYRVPSGVDPSLPIATNISARIERTLIRRTLADATEWGMKQGLDLRTESDVEQQLRAYEESDDLDLRDALLVEFRKGAVPLHTKSPRYLSDIDSGSESEDDDYQAESESDEAPANSRAEKRRAKKPKTGNSSGPRDPEYRLNMMFKRGAPKKRRKKGDPGAPAPAPAPVAPASKSNSNSLPTLPVDSKGFQLRPPDYGPVAFPTQTVDHVSLGRIDRPLGASGQVHPMVTAGRPSAPEPATGLRVGTSSRFDASDRNTGIVDAHKGHMFALELGGPDRPENIVAQFGQWQAVGAWRQAETKVLDAAKEAEARGMRLRLEVKLGYKQYAELEQATRKGLLFPKHFTMIITEIDPKTRAVVGSPITLFDEEQIQDFRTLRENNKALDALDARDIPSSELSEDEESTSDEDDEEEEGPSE